MEETLDEIKICNCVNPTNLLNKIIALLECELTKNDISNIVEKVYNYISLSQNGSWIMDLSNITRLLEICGERLNDVPAFKDVLMYTLNLCKIPVFLKLSSDVLTYSDEIKEHFAMLGYLLLYLEDVELKLNVMKTLKCLLENKAKCKNQLSLEVRKREASTGRFPAILGQALFLINDELYKPLLELTFKFVFDSPVTSRALAINDILNTVLVKMEETWRERYPNKPPYEDKSPGFEYLSTSLSLVCIIVTYLNSNKEVLKDVPVISRFSLWNIRYLFHYVTKDLKLKNYRNHLLTCLMWLMELFPAMDFVSSGLAEKIVEDLTSEFNNIFDFFVQKERTTTENFIFVKLCLFCITLFVKFENGKWVLERFRMINRLLKIINSQYSGVLEHVCIIKIITFKVLNKLVPHLQEEFIENSGPITLLNVIKNVSTDISGLIIAMTCLDTIRCVLQRDKNKSVTNSILFNDGINLLLGFCKELQKPPEFKDKAQACLEEIFCILNLLFESHIDLMTLNLTEIVEVPLTLLNRFLLPKPGEPLYDNRIIIDVMNFVWEVIIKNEPFCEEFCKQNGVYVMLDLIHEYPTPIKLHTLAALVDMCDYTEGQCIPYLITWSGKKGMKVIPLFMEIFRQENKKLGVKSGPEGQIGDTDHPLMGTDQYELVFKTKQFESSPAINDLYASCRPKIYAILTLMNERYGSILEIASERYKTDEQLSAKDRGTLLLAENFLALKLGETWEELKIEFEKLEFEPLSTDSHIINSLVQRTYRWGKVLKNIQEEFITNERRMQNVKEREMYIKLLDSRISAALESINDAKYIARCTERMFRVAQKYAQIHQVEKTMNKIVHGHNVHKTFMASIPVTRVFRKNIIIKNDVKLPQTLLSKNNITEKFTAAINCPFPDNQDYMPVTD